MRELWIPYNGNVNGAEKGISVISRVFPVPYLASLATLEGLLKLSTTEVFEVPAVTMVSVCLPKRMPANCSCAGHHKPMEARSQKVFLDFVWYAVAILCVEDDPHSGSSPSVELFMVQGFTL